MGFDGPGWSVYLCTGSISISHTHKVLACFEAIFGENPSSPVRGCHWCFFILWHQTLCVNFYSMKWWQKVWARWTIQLCSEQSVQFKTVTCFNDRCFKSHSEKPVCGKASPLTLFALVIWKRRQFCNAHALRTVLSSLEVQNSVSGSAACDLLAVTKWIPSKMLISFYMNHFWKSRYFCALL